MPQFILKLYLYFSLLFYFIVNIIQHILSEFYIFKFQFFIA